MKHFVKKAKAFITAILDVRTTFASALDVKGAAGAAIAGDVIPMDTTGFNLGNTMTPVYVVFGVTTAFLSAGAATVAFSLMSHSTATVTSGVTHVSTGAIAKADLAVGDTFAIPLPQGTYGLFLGVVATTAVATTTAGAVNAYLTLDPPTAWKPYADAIGNDQIAG